MSESIMPPGDFDPTQIERDSTIGKFYRFVEEIVTKPFEDTIASYRRPSVSGVDPYIARGLKARAKAHIVELYTADSGEATLNPRHPAMILRGEGPKSSYDEMFERVTGNMVVGSVSVSDRIKTDHDITQEETTCLFTRDGAGGFDMVYAPEYITLNAVDFHARSDNQVEHTDLQQFETYMRKTSEFILEPVPVEVAQELSDYLKELIDDHPRQLALFDQAREAYLAELDRESTLRGKAGMRLGRVAGRLVRKRHN